jgi:hypothetical protein
MIAVFPLCAAESPVPVSALRFNSEGTAIMTNFKTKLVLSAIGIALLATPALAQKAHHQVARHHAASSETAHHATGSEAIIPSSGEYGGSFGE